MKKIAHICRLILGVLFVFSGFVKGIDPLGMTYKIIDYLEAFHLEALEPLAHASAIFLCFTEFAIGMMLLSGVLVPLFSTLALLFILFFTALTYYSALYNPVSDCGCFGDAIKLTNWQTFYKNIVFTIMAILLFIERKNLIFYLKCVVRSTIAATGLVFFLVVMIHSIRHLPIIDYRPFKEGVNITEAMSIPEDAPADVYENTFYYKNRQTGKVEQFTDKEYPWNDTINWTFDHMDEPKLISKGYEPSISEFFVETAEGDNVADYFLEEDNYTLFWIAYRLDKASDKNLEETEELAQWASEKGYNFIGLTSNLPDEIIQFKEEKNISFDILQSDETVLKTIIRSNPGLMVTYKGTIVKKYHYNDIPSPEKFEKEILKNK